MVVWRRKAKHEGLNEFRPPNYNTKSNRTDSSFEFYSKDLFLWVWLLCAWFICRHKHSPKDRESLVASKSPRRSGKSPEVGNAAYMLFFVHMLDRARLRELSCLSWTCCWLTLAHASANTLQLTDIQHCGDLAGEGVCRKISPVKCVAEQVVMTVHSVLFQQHRQQFRQAGY